MQILIVVEQFPVLTETFVIARVHALLQRGYKITVLCNKKNVRLLKQFFKDRKQPVVHTFPVLMQLLYIVNPKFLKVAFKLKKKRDFHTLCAIAFVDFFKADVVHFEFSAIGIKYEKYLQLLNSKVVVSCRGTAEKVKLPFCSNRQRMFRSMIEKVDKIHCVSTDMATTIAPFCNAGNKIVVIKPAIDTAYFSKDANERPADKQAILSVGRLVFAKGFAFGLHAMSILKRKGVSFNWYIVGEGEKKDELEFKIHSLNLENEVHLLGSRSREEIRNLMAASAVFYLPSVYEGVANAVLEAMSMECSIVSTRCGGMPEIIDHGVNGLLCDEFDFDEHAAAFLSLFSSEKLSRQLGKNARQTVCDRHSISKQTDAFEMFYAFK